MSETMPVLVEVTRGSIVESRHRGAVAAAEPDGSTVASAGDEDSVVSTRSTIKPIQAIPVITSGAADRFNFTPPELALICASHNGEPMHTEAVRRMLARIGLDESTLLWGAHPPYGKDTAKRMEREGLAFTQLHNTCSGKHTGMLATAVHLGLSIEDYISPEHPVQREIIATFRRMAGVAGEMPVALDGCSAPTFGVSLKALAVAFARLVAPCGEGAGAPKADLDPAQNLSSPYLNDAAKRLVRAMMAHPEMVEGAGELDTDLMREAGGSLVAKTGAKGSYGIGVLPCRQFPRGLGVAITIEDGSEQPLKSVVIETLIQLGLLGDDSRKRLYAYHRPAQKNHRGFEVGATRTVFDLQRPAHMALTPH